MTTPNRSQSYSSHCKKVLEESNKSSTDVDIDNCIKKIFDNFQIPCYITSKSIDVKILFPESNISDSIQIDLIGAIGSTGLIIETTNQEKKITKKINRFQQSYRYFVSSKLSIQEKIKLLNIPDPNAIKYFQYVTKWKFLFFGLSENVDGLEESELPNNDNLSIFNRSQLKYLYDISNKIGEYGRYELFDRLSINFDEIEVDSQGEEINIPAFRIKDTIFLFKDDITASLFTFKISVHRLLMLSKVLRYGSLYSKIPELGSETYQRILQDKKLDSMRRNISQKKGKVSFPNALTVILSEDIVEQECDNTVSLKVPKKFGVFEVVDGQHRLFAFTKAQLTPYDLKVAELFVIGVKFANISKENRSKWAAATFIEINKNQTPVQSELINLIGYSAMEDHNPESLATRILILLNIDKNSPLFGVFSTNPNIPLKKRKPVKTVTITAVLSKLFNFNSDLFHNSFKVKDFDHNRKEDIEMVITQGKQIVDTYFKFVSETFDNDWNSNDSNIYSSKYMAAFCSLLIQFKSDSLDNNGIKRKLQGLKSNIIKELSRNNVPFDTSGPIFVNSVDQIPDKMAHQTRINQFLKERI